MCHSWHRTTPTVGMLRKTWIKTKQWFANLTNPYFIPNRTQRTCQVLELRHFITSWLILTLMAATHLKDVGTNSWKSSWWRIKTKWGSISQLMRLNRNRSVTWLEIKWAFQRDRASSSNCIGKKNCGITPEITLWTVRCSIHEVKAVQRRSKKEEGLH